MFGHTWETPDAVALLESESALALDFSKTPRTDRSLNLCTLHRHRQRVLAKSNGATLVKNMGLIIKGVGAWECNSLGSLRRCTNIEQTETTREILITFRAALPPLCHTKCKQTADRLSAHPSCKALTSFLVYTSLQAYLLRANSFTHLHIHRRGR